MESNLPRGKLTRQSADEFSSKLPLLELADQGLERAPEDLRHIPRGDLMAQQLLRVPQHVIGVPVDGELEREALG